MKHLATVLMVLALMGCAATGPTRGAKSDIDSLTTAIIALSSDVDADEAARAARLAYAHSQTLAIAYEITDPPLIHNAKVNAGLRPRGLCYHWAEDMERRLNAENFRTLTMARAIANSESRFLIDHSTAVIVAKGEKMQQGIVLDPWRKGGALFWSAVRDDTRYDWKPREDVLRARGLVRYAQRPDTSLAALPADLAN